MLETPDVVPVDQSQEFIAACREHGLSVTHQRLAIYTALTQTEEHPSAERTFALVRERYPTISLATVYKTLETLEAIGLIKKVNALHDVARYDATLGPHHHLVCTACHGVFDYHDPALDALPVPEVALDGRFAVEGYQVQINGVCDACREAAAA